MSQPDQALELKYEALEIACLHDERLDIAHAHSDIAEVLVVMHNNSKAQIHLQQAISLFHDAGAIAREASAKTRLKDLILSLSDVPKAT